MLIRRNGGALRLSTGAVLYAARRAVLLAVLVGATLEPIDQLQRIGLVANELACFAGA